MGLIVATCRLQSSGSQVVAHWLSCHVACGIFPDQGLNWCPLHYKVDSYPLDHQGIPKLENSYRLTGRRQWQPTPVLLPGKSHGWRSLVGCRPWAGQESDTTERLHFHFSLSCIGEGNGNPLQCSCLENPRDGGAWWSAIYGVTQSRTRLKRLSSSSSHPYGRK